MRQIPAQLHEIESRAELSLPLLKHVTDINLKVKEPVLVLQKQLDNLKRMRTFMQEADFKSIVEAFVQTKCERDAPNLPNQAPPPTKHELIFEEINLLVAHSR